jgi:hypothetical protein
MMSVRAAVHEWTKTERAWESWEKARQERGTEKSVGPYSASEHLAIVLILGRRGMNGSVR